MPMWTEEMAEGSAPMKGVQVINDYWEIENQASHLAAQYQVVIPENIHIQTTLNGLSGVYLYSYSSIRAHICHNK